mgnify:CR=1 FL=1
MGKKIGICLLVLLALHSLPGCSIPNSVDIPETTTAVTTEPVKTGWHTVGEAVYYYDLQGVAVTGWQEIDGKRYYFADDGVLQTGWLKQETGVYYLGNDGAMVTGWLQQEQDQYYFGKTGEMAVGQVEIDGVSNFFTSQGKHVLLVNFENEVPNDYQPNLVKFGDYKIDASCADALGQLFDACKDAGYKCKINSAYRSKQQQQKLWDKYYQKYRDAGYSKKAATEKVGKSVAKPGSSEHHLGLAVDVGGNEKMQKWMKNHAWEYGFIVRYPEGKTNYTGIIYEPWHIRYVGKELAKELYELDLCMEEYMEKLTTSHSGLAG